MKYSSKNCLRELAMGRLADFYDRLKAECESKKDKDGNPLKFLPIRKCDLNCFVEYYTSENRPLSMEMRVFKYFCSDEELPNEKAAKKREESISDYETLAKMYER